MGLLLLLVVLGQTPPATPSAASPSEGGIRDRYQRASLSTAPADVTRTVFEFRRQDGGTYDCVAPDSCSTRSSAPFEEAFTTNLPDDHWCFHGRYENDAGTSAFSAERCYLEDKTPPPQPSFVDAGFVNGLAVIDYLGSEDVGAAPSLVESFCARARDEVTGDLYGPYCNAGPWGRYRTPDAGNFFAYTLRLPMPPGVWTVGVVAIDRASYGSAIAWGPTFTIVEQGPPPPPPYWRDVDGGVAPDDTWTRDQYLGRTVFPAIAGHQGAIIQKRDENGTWESVSTLLGLSGSTSIYVRPGVVRKQVRYAMVNGDGGTSPWSNALNLRLDTVSPAPLSACAWAVPPRMNTIDVTFAGGVDALSRSSYVARLSPSTDGGVLAFPLGAGGGSFVAPDGTYQLSLEARDEAGNATTLVCSTSVVFPGPELDAGTPDAGDVDAGQLDAGQLDPGPDAGLDAGATARDAGSEPDAGIPEHRDLGVGCACGAVSPSLAWLGVVLFAFTARARRRPGTRR